MVDIVRGVGFKRVIWGVVVEIASLYIAGEMTYDGEGVREEGLRWEER